MRNTTSTRGEWGEWVSNGEAYARAGGRRRYNARRQFKADYRRYRLTCLARQSGINPFRRGAQTTLARMLGVSRATVCRDIAVMLKAWQQSKRCPVCGCQRMHFWRDSERPPGSNLP